MRYALLPGAAVVTLLAGACLVSAADGFAEPGWYLVVETEALGKAILQGPFPTEEACVERKPPDEPDATYACERFATQPSFDKPQ